MKKIKFINGSFKVLKLLNYFDETDLHKLFARMSKNSIEQRFFANKKQLDSSDISSFLTNTTIGLYEPVVGSVDGILIGVGQLFKIPNTPEAEFAIMIADEYQGKGYGKVLLEEIIQYAKINQIDYLTGVYLKRNVAVNKLNSGSLESVSKVYEDDVVVETYTLDNTPIDYIDVLLDLAANQTSLLFKSIKHF